MMLQGREFQKQTSFLIFQGLSRCSPLFVPSLENKDNGPLRKFTGMAFVGDLGKHLEPERA